MSSVAIHAAHYAAGPSPMESRPKRIGSIGRMFSAKRQATERREANAALLGQVIDGLALSNADAGSELGGERAMRQLRTATAALTVDKLDRMPLSVQREFYTRKLSQLDGKRDEPDIEPERVSMQLTAANGELAADLVEALSDGVLDAKECRKLIPVTARMCRLCTRLGRSLVRRSRVK